MDFNTSEKNGYTTHKDSMTDIVKNGNRDLLDF